MRFILSFLIMSWFSAQCIGQEHPFVGLWEVMKVSAGDQSMTPVARWSEILPDGTYRSGNGWLRSASGVWKYNSEDAEIEFIEKTSLIDEAGSFKITTNAETMTWQRQEQGMEVNVLLKRVEDFPMSTADKTTGLWAVTGHEKEESISETDSEDIRTIFLRWDRIYVENSKSGQKTGFWHMHAKRPSLTLIPHGDNSEQEYWSVSIDGDKMTWTGSGENNKSQKINFARLNRRP